MSDVHADRRPPSDPEVPLDLEEAGQALLAEARGMASGRAAKSLTPGAHAPLTQTLMALRSGTELGDHDANGPATILLVRGRATLVSSEGSVELSTGQWAPIPAVVHSLSAAEDTIALLTVAPTASRPSG
jgi:quercetin dioxygenase-like cupin family protein